MSAGWVAGSVRARALARRRLGSEGARQVARAGSLREALGIVAGTPYGRRIHPGLSVGEAQHMVARTLLWHLRVLGGWLPRGGVVMLRALAGWFEIANTDELLDGLTGGTGDTGNRDAFDLGALATAWPRLRAAGSLAELRAALASSAWGDPGGRDRRAIRLGMHVSWAARVAALPSPAESWAAGAMALLAAGERLASGRELPDPVRGAVSSIAGDAAVRAATLEDLARGLPARARWVLQAGATTGDLWQAEARWWARLERDGFTLLASPGPTSEPVLGAVAVLAVDAWRLRAALEMAARGGRPLRAYDEVAYNPAGYGVETRNATA